MDFSWHEMGLLEEFSKTNVDVECRRTRRRRSRMEACLCVTMCKPMLEKSMNCVKFDAAISVTIWTLILRCLACIYCGVTRWLFLVYFCKAVLKRIWTFSVKRENDWDEHELNNMQSTKCCSGFLQQWTHRYEMLETKLAITSICKLLFDDLLLNRRKRDSQCSVGIPNTYLSGMCIAEPTPR